MAKLGMPSINISFIEAGIEAIQRSQRGIVALILEEATDTITKLKTDHTVGDDTAKAIENPFTIYTTFIFYFCFFMKLKMKIFS